MPTVAEAVQCARSVLHSTGVPDAWLDAELLVAHALACSRTDLYAHPERALTTHEAAALQTLVSRRAKREPLAYILGRREFYGLDFQVSPEALVPRPETELLMDRALAFARSRGSAALRIADVGTGSGCVAVSLAVHLPQAVVYAVDASSSALDVARRNAAAHGVARRVRFLQGHLLEPLPERVDIIVANLPYIPESDVVDLQPEVRDYEPRAALTPGPDGAALVRQMLASAPQHLLPGGVVYAEFHSPQRAELVSAAQTAFPDARITVAQDLAGLDRVLCVETA
jgi:release factor glutamine methyltransferase